MARSRLPLLLPPLALSGAAALVLEVVWMRRLALLTGSGGLAVVLTLALYMAGLGLGGLVAGRAAWRRAPLGYGCVEAAAAVWALAFPLLLDLFVPLPPEGAGLALAAAALLLPPACLAGATLPAAAAALATPREAAVLYAVNTAGAVAGTLAGPFLLLPYLGIRGTEVAAALAAATAGAWAVGLGLQGVRPAPVAHPTPATARASRVVLVAAGTAGLAAMALEVSWTRLCALLLGGSVHALALVLAVFLAGVAVGAGRFGRARYLAPALLWLGLLAAAGTLAWRWLPHGLGLAWALGGEALHLPAGAVLLALAMGGAPVASGAVFGAALDASGGSASRAAGRVLAANTAGGVAGTVLAGLPGLPRLGVQGVTAWVAILAVAVAILLPGLPRRWRFGGPLAMAVLALATPRWDPYQWAVGFGLRVSEFVDLSPRAVERFAHEGWDLLAYEDGITGTVAVGRSRRTGHRWLSVNGKVDASTGRDMATQEASGRIPVQVALAHGPVDRVLVVGLASGVTAGRALEAGARAVTVVEIEAAVVRAARWFQAVNGGVLADPRTTLVLADARAFLQRRGPAFDVIVSEPSNPWITGVSSLFTEEYWRLARARLAPDGVFCQWVQLYDLPPEALRSLVASFLDVFPRTWLFETIPAADALLVAAPDLPGDLEPLLGPAELAALAAGARRNTDDRPWVEFEAPRWLHRSTGEENAALLDAATGPLRAAPGGPPP